MTDVEKQYWNNYEEPYEGMALVGPYRALLDEVVTAAGLSSGQRLLDVGCGAGDLMWMLRLRELACAVTGLDIASKMIERAEQEAARYRRSGGTARFVEADLRQPLTSWDLATGQYHCLVANHSLYPFRNLSEVLRKLARLAAPEATLVVTLPKLGASTEPVMQQHQRNTGASPEQMQQLRDQIKALMQEAPVLLEERFVGNLFATEKELRERFEQTGWRVTQVRSTYADQDWLVIAKRINTGQIKAWTVETPADRELSRQTRREVLGELEDEAAVQALPHEVIATYSDLPIGIGGILLEPNLQSANILSQAGLPLPSGKLAEPTRTGILAEFQQTELGRAIARRMVGLLIQQSRTLGCTHWITTMRLPMFRLLRHLPWRLGDWIYYPEDKGGPRLARPEPIMTATLDLAAAQDSLCMLRPDLYWIMFGAPPTEPSSFSDAEELQNQIERTLRDVLAYQRDWEQGRVIPLTIG